MSIVVEAIHELLDVFMNKGVMRDVPGPVGQLRLGWKLAVQDEVSHLEIVALLRQLLDGVAAVAQNTLITINEGDLAPAGSRVHEGRIIGHQTEVIVRDLYLAQ